jgi:hypothetical protein
MKCTSQHVATGGADGDGDAGGGLARQMRALQQQANDMCVYALE